MLSQKLLATVLSVTIYVALQKYPCRKLNTSLYTCTCTTLKIDSHCSMSVFSSIPDYEITAGQMLILDIQ